MRVVEAIERRRAAIYPNDKTLLGLYATTGELILFTVTLGANPANDLTSPPPLISARALLAVRDAALAQHECKRRRAAPPRARRREAFAALLLLLLLVGGVNLLRVLLFARGARLEPAAQDSLAERGARRWRAALDAGRWSRPPPRAASAVPHRALALTPADAGVGGHRSSAHSEDGGLASAAAAAAGVQQREARRAAAAAPRRGRGLRRSAARAAPPHPGRVRRRRSVLSARIARCNEMNSSRETSIL